MDGFSIRYARREDVPVLLGLIRELAAYEDMSDQVTATEGLLEESLFERRIAEALIGEIGGEPAGFTLFFHNFSTFLGMPGIYLEDLYVREAYRGRGFGSQLIGALARLCTERRCGRLEWSCLDWNAPSIRFYTEALGATPMDEWTVYRLTGDTLERAAHRCTVSVQP